MNKCFPYGIKIILDKTLIKAQVELYVVVSLDVIFSMTSSFSFSYDELLTLRNVISLLLLRFSVHIAIET